MQVLGRLRGPGEGLVLAEMKKGARILQRNRSCAFPDRSLGPVQRAPGSAHGPPGTQSSFRGPCVGVGAHLLPASHRLREPWRGGLAEKLRLSLPTFPGGRTTSSERALLT